MSYAPGAPPAALAPAEERALRHLAGVIVVPCTNRVPAHARRSLAMNIALRYHFLCPDDRAVLSVVAVRPKGETPLAERRIYFGLCPACGFKWWGPKIGELG